MVIKHLVIAGGGPVLVQILASIQELEKHKYLNMKDITSIYGTSAGAIIAVFISLNFDWETINDYIIKRPWQDVFQIKPQTILDAYSNKGIFDIKTVEKCFKPMFDAKDIPIDITMKGFYELTNIELHIFSFEINKYKTEDISFKTHPELSLITAIQMTSAIPVLISPVFIEDQCFMDGGVGCNYPLSYCIESGKHPDEILGFKTNFSSSKANITTDCNLLDYLLNFLFKSVFNVNNNCIQPVIQNQVVFESGCFSLDVLKTAISNIAVRRELFEKGKQSATTFLAGNLGSLLKK